MIRLGRLLPALVLALAACGGGAGTATGDLTVTDAWARASTGMGMAGAAYLTIANGTGTDDTLLAVRTDAARSPEIHETTSSGGMMGMQKVDRVPVPAGKTVRLEPGGLHVMLIGLTGELVPGSTIELVLVFETAGEVTVTAEVRAS